MRVYQTKFRHENAKDHMDTRRASARRFVHTISPVCVRRVRARLVSRAYTAIEFRNGSIIRN